MVSKPFTRGSALSASSAMGHKRFFDILRGFHGKGKVLRGRGQAQPFFQRAGGVVRSGGAGVGLRGMGGESSGGREGKLLLFI